ncbi:MAG: hypothetical protein RLZZ200_1755 [Pseudomonadota bacterium]|jgi:hypothetical protein
MSIRALLLTGLAVAGAGISGCSKVPACGDPEALALVGAQFKDNATAQLKTRFAIPFLNEEARQTLARLFAPDAVKLSEMRSVSVDGDLKLRQCTARAELTYAMEGRVEKAKAELQHGAISGQSVAYMLDGEPYLSAVKKIAPQVLTDLSYSVQATDDGHLHVETQVRDLPVF